MLAWLVAALLPCMVGCGRNKVEALAIPAELSHVIADGMAFSARGEILALPGYKGPVTLLDVATGKRDVLPLPAGARPEPGRVAFSKSRRSLAVMNPGLGITIWDLRSKKPEFVLPLSPETEVESMAFHDGDQTLQATTLGKTGTDLKSPWDYGVVRWDTATGERRDAEDFGRHPLTVINSPNGRYGVIWEKDKKSLHDFKAGGKPLELGSWNKKAIFTADGSTLVVCDPNSIKLLEVPSGRERRRLAVDPPFDPGVLHLALSADARLLAGPPHQDSDLQ